MKPRFLADADFNYKIVVGLLRREPSIDILGPHAAGIISLPDPQVLQAARESGRILLSHDRRTMPAHFRQAPKPSAGLIVVPQALDPGTVIEDLLLIWSVTTATEWTDQIGFLPL